MAKRRRKTSGRRRAGKLAKHGRTAAERKAYLRYLAEKRALIRKRFG